MAKAPWLCWVGCGSKMGASSIAYGRWGDSVRQIFARHFGRVFCQTERKQWDGGPIGVYTEHWNLGVWDEIGADRRDLTYFWWDPLDSPVLEFCHYQGVCVCMFNFKIIWRNYWLVKSWQTQPTFGKKGYQRRAWPCPNYQGGPWTRMHPLSESRNEIVVDSWRRGLYYFP